MTLRRIVVSLGLAAGLLACASSAGAADVRSRARALRRQQPRRRRMTCPRASPGSPPPPGDASSTRKSPSAASASRDDCNRRERRARRCATGRWNVVIMQQGPSALPESQIDLRLWAGRFRRRGTRRRNPAGSVDGLAGERSMACTVRRDRLLRAAPPRRRVHSSLPPGRRGRVRLGMQTGVSPLYGPDGFHLSALGTYVAALVVYGRLFKALLHRGLAPPRGEAEDRKLCCRLLLRGPSGGRCLRRSAAARVADVPQVGLSVDPRQLSSRPP